MNIIHELNFAKDFDAYEQGTALHQNWLFSLDESIIGFIVFCDKNGDHREECLRLLKKADDIPEEGMRSEGLIALPNMGADLSQSISLIFIPRELASRGLTVNKQVCPPPCRLEVWTVCKGNDKLDVLCKPTAVAVRQMTLRLSIKRMEIEKAQTKNRILGGLLPFKKSNAVYGTRLVLTPDNREHKYLSGAVYYTVKTDPEANGIRYPITASALGQTLEFANITPEYFSVGVEEKYKELYTVVTE